MIEAILQSSTSGDRPNTEPSIPRITKEADPEPSHTRPRKVRRRQKAPEAPQETLEPVFAVSYEDSGAWRSPAEDPEPSFSSLGPPVSQAFGGLDSTMDALDEDLTTPEPLPESALPMAPPVQTVPDPLPGLDPLEDEETGPFDTVPERTEEPEPVVEELAPISASPMEDSTEQRPPPMAPALRPPPQLASRPPDSLPPLSGGRGLSYRIKRGHDGRPLKTRIPGRMTLSEAVAFLTGTAVPVRTDLQGRVREGYRLGPESGPAVGDTPIQRFPEESTLVLHPVPAREEWVELEVRQGEPATLFRVPVNVALSACSVVDAIAAWLELPPGRWTLFLGDQPVGAHTLMDELPLEGARLILRR